MKKWMKWTIAGICIVGIIAFIGWRLVAGSIETPLRTVQAERQTITKDVTFSGTVSAMQSSDVGFELTGSIQSLYAKVGDSVVKGQLLARLNPESVNLELAKATADKESSTSVEYLSWQKASGDATNTKAENAKLLAEKRQAVRNAKAALDQAREVREVTADEGDSDISTETSESSVVAAENAYLAAQKSLETSMETVKKSNAAIQKTADIAYASYIATTQASTSSSGLSSLEALEALARVKAAKSVLRAPFSGVVTKRAGEIGEIAAAGQGIFTVETLSTLEITADVPETDALALQPGMKSDVTFDALPSDASLSTTVASIDPAAVVIQGVPTFKVTLSLGSTPQALRSGITSNITVHVAEKENVIGIPRRALITKQGAEFVKIQKEDGTEEERKVITGLVGSDGTVEIVSGLSEGETIVTP